MKKEGEKMTKLLKKLIGIVPLFTSIGLFSTGFSAWVLIESIAVVEVPVAVEDMVHIITLDTTQGNGLGYDTFTLGQYGFQVINNEDPTNITYVLTGQIKYYLNFDTEAASEFLYDTNKAKINTRLSVNNETTKDFLNDSDLTVTQKVNNVAYTPEPTIVNNKVTSYHAQTELTGITFDSPLFAFTITYDFSISNYDSYIALFENVISGGALSFSFTMNVVKEGA